MKRNYRLTALALALLCSMRAMPVMASSEVEEEPQEAAYFGSSDLALRGLQVVSSFNRDYPSAPNGTAAVLGGEADKIVTFAKKQQFNAIFYEISPRADAVYRSNYLPSSRYVTEEEGDFLLSDPLSVLMETADMEKINLCVTISMLYAGEVNDAYAKDSPVRLHPEWFIERDGSLYFDPSKEEVREFWASVLKELVENYELDGIVLSGFSDLDDSFANDIAVLIEYCISTVHQINSQLSIGISLEHDCIESPLWQQSIASLKYTINFIMPEMRTSLSSPDDYQTCLEQWTSLMEDGSARLYTVNMASLLNYPLVGDTVYGDERELAYQLYANNSKDCNGFVLHSYQDVSGLRSSLMEEINLVPESSNADRALSYSSEPEFYVAEEESLIRTTYTSYYLSGRCDPTQPLYINNEILDPSRISEEGFWTVLLDLDRGSNRISVRQNDQTLRLIIHSTIRQEKEPVRINDIAEDSVYPLQNEVLFEGEQLILSCTAPYGGEVLATFMGKTYHLLPPEGLTDADLDKPVEYSLLVPLENIDSTQVTNLGKVSYILRYKDFTSKYRSEGQIYLIGSSSRLAVRVEDSIGHIYSSLDADVLLTNLPNGVCDYAYTTQNPDYFRLYSGGYIHRDDVAIIEGIVDIQKSIEAVGIQSHEQGENLVFVGGAGLPYYCSFNEHSGTLILQLNNAVELPSSLAYLSSEMFDSISVQSNEYLGTYTIRLHLAKGKTLWGYELSYEDGNLYLKCKTPPLLSNDPSAPLKDVSFVLDAGHGGVDRGKHTVSGSRGPAEKDITLAYVQSLRRRLESLGAEVYLTRTDDSVLDEESRILYSSYKDADFYLSFHGSSTGKQYDGYSESGISVYYDNEMSHDLGSYLFYQMADRLNLELNHLSGSELSVTKVPLAQALMICPGVLSNPNDYIRMTNPVDIYKSSCVLSDLLIDYIKGL